MLNIFHRIFNIKKPEKISFQEKFNYFQELLSANDESHKSMSDLAEMIANGEPFSKGNANKAFTNLTENTKTIVENLSLLSDGRYKKLIIKFNEIETACNAVRSPRFYCPEGWDCPDDDCSVCEKVQSLPDEIPYSYNLTEVNDEKYLEVGNKMSRLGELKNILGLPVPEGFCLTVRLFEDIMLEDNLRQRKDKIFEDVNFNDIEQVERASREAQALLITSTIQKHIEGTILDAFDRTFKKEKNIRLAVRSSALGEDSAKYSFAGLHHSELNVSRENLVDACWEVLISKYSPQSVVYRYINGLRDEDMPMSVGCIKMIQAKAGGVLFTEDPNKQKNGIIIQSVFGIGSLVVEGKVKPQEYLVEHNENAKILNFRTGNQHYKKVAWEREGIGREDILQEFIQTPNLTDNEIKTLEIGRAHV